MLDPEKGGRFTLAPPSEFEVARRYVGRTNILETTYRTGDGVVRITEGLTLQDGGLLPGSSSRGGSRGSRGRSHWSGGSSHGSTGDARQPADRPPRGHRLRRGRGTRARRPLLGRGRGRRRRRTRSPVHSRSRTASERSSRSSPPASSRCPCRAATASRRGSTRRSASGSAGWGCGLRRPVGRGGGPERARAQAASSTPRQGSIAAAPTTSLPEVVGGDKNSTTATPGYATRRSRSTR